MPESGQRQQQSITRQVPSVYVIESIKSINQ